MIPWITTFLFLVICGELVTNRQLVLAKQYSEPVLDNQLFTYDLSLACLAIPTWNLHTWYQSWIYFGSFRLIDDYTLKLLNCYVSLSRELDVAPG
jgi:hypothetical protein